MDKEFNSHLDLEKSNFHVILETCVDAVVIINRNGIVEFFNLAAEALWGYQKSEVIGENVSILMPAYHSKRHDQYLKNFIETKEAKVIGIGREVQLQTKSGEKIPIMLTLNDSEINGELIFTAFIKDLRSMKKVEDELKSAKEKAEQSQKAQELFLANISHEIRTPMNAILGMSELLSNTPLAENQKQFLDSIRKSSKSLITLINDILDFSKIRSGRLDLEKIPFQLNENLKSIYNIYFHKAYEKRLKFSINNPYEKDNLVIIGDPVRLNQILYNLIDNAIKFTHEGQVELKIEAEFLKNSIRLTFKVADTGIGIEKAKLNKIFHSFDQADSSTTRQYGGTGLGLAIAHNTVEAMGGKINISSRPGTGTTFCVTI
ncbi:MAG: hypothetical protein C0594_12770, partial [Marinilabiliales bacterium]